MDLKNKKEIIKYALWGATIAFWLAIGVYAYLGVYSRFMSDDYCESVVIRASSNPLSAVLERYMLGSWPRASMRYSNLLFTGLSEVFGLVGLRMTMPVMILLWGLGSALFFREFSRLFFKEISLQVSLFFGGLLAFFSLLLAPNMFQLLYWRSAVMTHFAPLVFACFFGAYLFYLARVINSYSRPFFVYAMVFFVAFVVAGFSEPPATTLFSLFGLILVVLFWGERSVLRTRRMLIVMSALLGTGVGILAMLSSPAVTPMAVGESRSVILVLFDSFLYSAQFLLDSFKKFPLPLFLIFALSFQAVWLFAQVETLPSAFLKGRQWLYVAALPLLLWVLVAASFAPSVYGQGFPVERARFLGMVLMIFFLLFMGALLGRLLASNTKAGAFAQWLVLGVFVLLAVMYPLRRAYSLWVDLLPEFSQRAYFWDLREAKILQLAQRGEIDLVVPGFSGIYDVKELDDDPAHWINACAADLYGVNSIRTVGVPVEQLEEVLTK